MVVWVKHINQNCAHRLHYHSFCSVYQPPFAHLPIRMFLRTQLLCCCIKISSSLHWLRFIMQCDLHCSTSKNNKRKNNTYYYFLFKICKQLIGSIHQLIWKRTHIFIPNYLWLRFHLSHRKYSYRIHQPSIVKNNTISLSHIIAIHKHLQASVSTQIIFR